MRVTATLILACGVFMLAGRGDHTPAFPVESGVEGVVHLGLECPVETAGEPCQDQPGKRTTVTVSEQLMDARVTAAIDSESTSPVTPASADPSPGTVDGGARLLAH